MSAQKKFLRLPAVIEIVGKQRTAIYKSIKDGTFPAPVRIGLRAVAWDSTEISQWQEKCIQAGRPAANK